MQAQKCQKKIYWWKLHFNLNFNSKLTRKNLNFAIQFSEGWGNAI